MTALQNNSLDLDIFYKKTDIPEMSVGDKVKVVIYLELPKEKELGNFEKKPLPLLPRTKHRLR